MELGHLDPADTQVFLDECRLGIHEQPHRGDEGWKRGNDGGGGFRGDEPGCSRHEDKAQRIHTGIDRHQGVFETGDPTEFDADRHGRRVMPGVAFLQSAIQ